MSAPTTKVLFSNGTQGTPSTFNTYMADDGYGGKIVPTVNSSGYLTSAVAYGNNYVVNYVSMTTDDYKNIALHEMGDVIGLGHGSLQFSSHVHVYEQGYMAYAD